MAIGRIPGVNGIPESIIDAKGDLIAGTSADNAVRLAVGTNDQRLVAASGEAAGLKYVSDTQNTVVDAKGDLIVGTGADTVARLAVGTNGHTLVADSSETTGLKWVAPAGGGGKVLQVVQDTTTTAETTTSGTYVDTNLSQSITPSSASSKVLIIAAFNGGVVRSSSDDANAIYNLVRTSTQIAEFVLGGKAPSGVSAFRGYGGWVYLDSPNTTSATTYKIQFKADNGTAYMAIDGRFSSLTLIEIGA